MTDFVEYRNLSPLLQLTHYSKKRVTRMRDSKQEERQPAFKPRGLWVSDDAEFGWAEWCDGEQFSRGEYRHFVYIGSKAKILHLASEDDLNKFDQQFGAPLMAGMSSRYIDWGKVSMIWDGIMITPYQWGCRFDLMWYYGWDCASGCIWNKKAVERIQSATRVAGFLG